MRTSRAVLLGAVVCLLALPACGPSGDAAGGSDPDSTPTSEPPAVASISVVRTYPREAATVWTLDRPLDAERPGAATAFEAAGRPAVRAMVGSDLDDERAGTEDLPAYRVAVVWEDGERLRVATGEGGLGPLLDVVRATQKAAEPVRG